MNKETIRNILSLLSPSTQKSNHIVVSGIPNNPIALDASHFSSLHLEEGTIAYIDGGNAEIIHSSSFSVHLIRVYGVVYEGKRRVSHMKKNFFVVIQPSGNSYRIETVGEGYTLPSFSMQDETLREGTNAVSISRLGGVARRFSELLLAQELISSVGSGGTIVLDGSLASTITGEETLLDSLREAGRQHNVSVCGLSKTCTFLTDTNEHALHALRNIAPKGSWLYHPVCDSSLTLFFTKLHEHSKHVFRVDTFGKPTVAHALAFHAHDPVFVGYPYGLVEADRFARISNTEKEMIRMQFMSAAGEDWGTVAQLLTSSDAHTILDTISF